MVIVSFAFPCDTTMAMKVGSYCVRAVPEFERCRQLPWWEWHLGVWSHSNPMLSQLLPTWNGCNYTSRLTVSKPREASASLFEHYWKESLCFAKELVVAREACTEASQGSHGHVEGIFWAQESCHCVSFSISSAAWGDSSNVSGRVAQVSSPTCL